MPTWERSKHGKKTQNEYFTFGAPGHLTYVTVYPNHNQTGWTFAIGKRYGQEYREKDEAKVAAETAALDPATWQPDFPQWRISQNGNFYCSRKTDGRTWIYTVTR